jgi:hypothetical protein
MDDEISFSEQDASITNSNEESPNISDLLADSKKSSIDSESYSIYSFALSEKDQESNLSESSLISSDMSGKYSDSVSLDSNESSVNTFPFY